MINESVSLITKPAAPRTRGLCDVGQEMYCSMTWHFWWIFKYLRPLWEQYVTLHLWLLVQKIFYDLPYHDFFLTSDISGQFFFVCNCGVCGLTVVWNSHSKTPQIRTLWSVRNACVCQWARFFMHTQYLYGSAAAEIG